MEQERPGLLRQRQEWFDEQLDLDPEKLVFIDETGLNTKMARIRGRALKGERCRAAVPHDRWKTTTFTGALRLTGMTAPMVLEGAMNGAAFLAYVSQVLAPTLYRTSHQIRSKSDLLLPSRLVEADGNEQKRLGVSSVFHGPPPEFHVFDDEDEEAEAVARWLDECMDSSFAAGTIALLVRSERELPRAQRAIAASRMPAVHPFLMHDAKGREFRAVAIMAADADVIPSEERLLAATDEQSLREIFDTERHLLYVAATRAREGLWISACDPVSEFLEDLLG